MTRVPCPRCRADDAILEHVGHADAGSEPWKVLRCERCSFSWRTTEPEETLDPGLRPAQFQLEVERIAGLRDVLPPRRS